MRDLTKIERDWILYDVGNSAFILIVTTIIPIYFKNLATTEGIEMATSTAYWGYASSFATVFTMFLGPILGAIGDRRDFKNKLYFGFAILGSIACALLGMVYGAITFLIIYVLGMVAFYLAMIFYDAMLNDITTHDRADDISSMGYAYGYIGSVIPFVLCLALIMLNETIGITKTKATQISFFITAIWWIAFSIPLANQYKKHYSEKIHRLTEAEKKEIVKINWSDGIKTIFADKKIFTFLIAYFLYIDGVFTIMKMATSYGKDMGIGDDSLLLAFLLTQIVAFPFALIFGKLSKKMKATKLIKICIFGYLGVVIFALQLDKAWEFWLLAVAVAMFQGGIQALSRSYFLKIIPKERTNEFFGFYEIFGKGASFTGTFLMSVITQLSGNSRMGLLGLAGLLITGFAVFLMHTRRYKEADYGSI